MRSRLTEGQRAAATLPHSLDAERAVLAAILLDNSAIGQAAEILAAEDFYAERHRLIYAEMLALFEDNSPIDAVTVADRLEHSGQLDRAGGRAYQSELIDGLPRMMNVAPHADIVKQNALLRRLVAAGRQTMNDAMAGSAIADIIAAAQVRMATIVDSTAGGVALVYSLEDYLDLRLKPRTALLAPVIREKDLIMVYGYRGVGKTFFGLSMGLAVATGTKFLTWDAPAPASVLLIDGEMPVETLQQRAASLLASIDTDMDIGEIPFRILAADAQDRPLPPLDTPEGQRIVDAHLGDTKLLILDNLSTLMGSGPENDAEAWEPAQRFLLSLRRRGVAVAMFHHAGKAGTQRGTSRREDVLDTVIKLERPRDYRAEQGARFKVTFEKARGLSGREIAPFEARLTTDESGLLTWCVGRIEGSTAERVAEMTTQGMSAKAIAAELGVHPSTVYRRLAKKDSS